MCWKKEVTLWYFSESEAISTIQNISRQYQNLWKFKTFRGFFLSTIGSKCITEIKWKEHELPFHPCFIYERFTFLFNFMYFSIFCTIYSSDKNTGAPVVTFLGYELINFAFLERKYQRNCFFVDIFMLLVYCVNFVRK